MDDWKCKLMSLVNVNRWRASSPFSWQDTERMTYQGQGRRLLWTKIQLSQFIVALEDITYQRSWDIMIQDSCEDKIHLVWTSSSNHQQMLPVWVWRHYGTARGTVDCRAAVFLFADKNGMKGYWKGAFHTRLHLNLYSNIITVFPKMYMTFDNVGGSSSNGIYQVDLRKSACIVLT